MSYSSFLSFQVARKHYEISQFTFRFSFQVARKHFEISQFTFRFTHCQKLELYDSWKNSAGLH